MKEYCHLENGIWYAELDGTKGPYALGLASGKAFEGLILKNIEHMKEVYCLDKHLIVIHLLLVVFPLCNFVDYLYHYYTYNSLLIFHLYGMNYIFF
jgi:hypothetical protein